MNTYHKKLIEGLRHFADAVDAMTPEQLAERVSKLGHMENVRFYAKLEQLLSREHTGSWQMQNENKEIVEINNELN